MKKKSFLCTYRFLWCSVLFSFSSLQAAHDAKKTKPTNAIQQKTQSTTCSHPNSYLINTPQSNHIKQDEDEEISPDAEDLKGIQQSIKNCDINPSANKHPAHAPTPCIGSPKKKYASLMERKQFIKAIGLTYLHYTTFSPSCQLLADFSSRDLTIDPHPETSKKYGHYIERNPPYIAPCFIKWYSDEVGYGFYANSSFKRGDFIIEFTGNVARSIDLQKKQWSWGYLSMDAFHDFPYSTCLDSTKSGNEARFINHSDAPNTKLKKFYHKGRWHLIYVAIKDIKKGEQFLINYGSNYWKRKTKINL